MYLCGFLHLALWLWEIMMQTISYVEYQWEVSGKAKAWFLLTWITHQMMAPFFKNPARLHRKQADFAQIN